MLLAALGVCLVVVGVRVFFENSIVCRCTLFCVDLVSARSFWLLFLFNLFGVPAPSPCRGGCTVFSDMNARPTRVVGLSFVFAGFELFTELAFVESLILAQDERWRRA